MNQKHQKGRKEERKKERKKALTQPSPLPQHLPIGHLDQRDRMLPAQRHHQLLVRLLLAPFVQHAHVRLSPVERLGGLAEPPGEAVVDERELQGAFEGFEGSLAGWAALVSGRFVMRWGWGGGGGSFLGWRSKGGGRASGWLEGMFGGCKVSPFENCHRRQARRRRHQWFGGLRRGWVRWALLRPTRVVRKC